MCSRTRVTTALSTSANSGEITRSLSVSVLDGAMCSRGTSSPLAGSRYWTRLEWVSSVSSSIRISLCRSTSTAAKAQNARCSSRVRLRRRPPFGSSAQTVAPGLRVVTDRRRVCPAAVNSCPGLVAAAAARRSAVTVRPVATAATRAGRTGRRSRVRASMRDLRRAASLRWGISPDLIGQGTAQGPHGRPANTPLTGTESPRAKWPDTSPTLSSHANPREARHDRPDGMLCVAGTSACEHPCRA